MISITRLVTTLTAIFALATVCLAQPRQVPEGAPDAWLETTK
jgi:hypothetical protein